MYIQIFPSSYLKLGKTNPIFSMEMPHFLSQNTTIDSKLSELGGANYLAAVEVPEK